MGKKLYVGNLPYGVSDSDLQRIFEPHGSVVSAQVIIDRDTNRSKGFGFVEMGSDQEAQTAIQALNGKDHDGRALTVNEARPREDRGGGGGGPGPGGDGRGGTEGRLAEGRSREPAALPRGARHEVQGRLLLQGQGPPPLDVPLLVGQVRLLHLLVPQHVLLVLLVSQGRVLLPGELYCDRHTGGPASPRGR